MNKFNLIGLVATLLVAAGSVHAGAEDSVGQLPAPGILGLVAAGVVAAIGIARLRK